MNAGKLILFTLIPCLFGWAALLVLGQKDSPSAEFAYFENDTMVIEELTSHVYSWMDSSGQGDRLVQRVPLPVGFVRIKQEDSSFGSWLRNLPLKKEGSPVMLYDGNEKWVQNGHFAIIDMDVGKNDLQQCADAVIRLRSEYLYQAGMKDRISFNFTSGDAAAYSEWQKGFRPVISGNNVSWAKNGNQGDNYPQFKSYLQTVFMYAGTLSLEKELTAKPIENIMPGDVFIEGGSPGHAVLVLDVAENPDSGERIFIIGQSYMPAQDFHVLVNPDDRNMSPWYRAGSMDILLTPSWTFKKSDLKRF